MTSHAKVNRNARELAGRRILHNVDHRVRGEALNFLVEIPANGTQSARETRPKLMQTVFP